MIKLIKLIMLSSLFVPNTLFKNEGIVELPNENSLPRMITMSIYNDSKTEMAFNYNTTWNTDTILQVVEKENGDFNSSSVKEYQGTSTKSLVLQDGFIHQVVATSLKEDTKYLYRLGEKELNCWSDVGEFKTANSSNKLNFVHISDPQGYEEYHYDAYNTLLKEVMKTSNPDFFVLTGDIVNDSYEGTNPKLEQWEWALTKQKDIMMNVPFMTTPGNHEASDNDYQSRFNHPIYEQGLTSKGSYYSFDYQGSHFISLNTNDTINEGRNDSRGLSQTQIDWLKNDLEKAQDSKFIVVMMHKGIYDAGGHCSNIDGEDNDIQYIRNQLTPIFSEYDVDLVLQGHDHLYSRSYPLKGTYKNETLEVIPSIDKNVENTTYQGVEYRTYLNPEGTIYLNSGTSSGSKYYQAVNYNKDLIPIEVEDSSDLKMYTSIEINEDNLYAKVYKISSGESVLFDTFAINKNVDIDDNNEDDKNQSSNNQTNQQDKQEFPYWIFGIISGVILVSTVAVIILKKKKGGNN